MTLNYLGFMLADKGTRVAEAVKLIRKAVEQEPMNGAYLDSLGWAYFKMGQYELAEENLRHAVERDQTDPTVHDHLAISMRRPVASASPRLNGNSRYRNMPSPLPPMSSPATWPRCSASLNPPASSSPSRITPAASPNRNNRFPCLT